MSWLWGKKTEEPQLTPLQAQRQKQLDSLKQQHRRIVEVNRDTSYRIPFNVGAQTFFLDITLGVMFPREPPSLRLTPKGTHTLVEASSGIINSPKMAAFNMHSDLGRLITEVIEEFQRNPPLMPRDFPPPDNGFGSSTGPSLYPNFPSQPPVTLPRRSDSPATFPPFPTTTLTHQTSQPMWSSVSDNFPEVMTMSDTDLQALLDSTEDQVLWDKMATAPVIASLKDEAKRLSELNRIVALENMARKPFLEKKKSKLFDLYSTAGELRQEFDDLQRQQETLAQQFDPQMIQEQIRIAAAEAEMQSDAVAEEFIAGKMDLDAFLGNFLEKRKLAHTRKATDDLFGRQVQNSF
ncbi:putative Vacuolar protein sorting-associated protein 37A [Hypsibius exemplaris]|uniref:Vacuolar protein sorting-associated protein 37A n=1 Tax=Hypsibius exemplaris TaxID=2072580 RepID=A0A9X6NGA0_HYPEX|nr:putative Vacuolar protein sorting-associated protein 37A [Hypsibius exemplaris]